MGSRLQSNVLRVKNSVDAFYGLAYERGWTDGLPVIPPTKEKIWEMLDYIGRDPDEEIAEIPPRFGLATVEKIAINAVMAGCLPEYLPVVIAAVEAASKPEFNLDHQQTTTAPSYQVVAINGPIRKKLGINCGRNCLGPGWRANSTIGRALRLCLLNIGGGIPNEVSKTTLGHPGRYTICFGEDEEGSKWEPLHVEKGFNPQDSTVTVIGVFCQIIVSTGPTQPSKETLLKELADSMAYPGSYNMHLGGGPYGVILQAGHTSLLQEWGLSKNDLKQYLFENTRVPLSSFPSDRFVEGEQPTPLVIDGMVLPLRSPEDVIIMVAGGPEPYIPQILPTHIGSVPQTVAIATK